MKLEKKKDFTVCVRIGYFTKYFPIAALLPIWWSVSREDQYVVFPSNCRRKRESEETTTSQR